MRSAEGVFVVSALVLLGSACVSLRRRLGGDSQDKKPPGLWGPGLKVSGFCTLSGSTGVHRGEHEEVVLDPAGECVCPPGFAVFLG